MAVVIANQLRKDIAGDPLFDGVSFKVERRDRLSLAGPNGAGKTTLLRILSGETELHGGELAFQKGTRVALHDQRPPLEFDITLREYALSGARDLLEVVAADAAGGLGRAPLGALLIVGAALSWALGTVLQKRFPVKMPTGAYTAWIMLLGGIPIFIGTLLFEDWRDLRRVGTAAWMGTAYNVFIAFAFAHWAWIKIATSVPVSVFSISMLLIPVVGVVSGMLFLGERPAWTEYAALVLVLAALLTVLRPGRVRRG